MAQYLKKNGKNDYITDIVDIEQARLNNLRHTILGCMLGDFDDAGRYVMSKEIVAELIEMPKYIIDSVDNIEICRGELVLDKSITFAVSFEVDCAVLSLLEKVNYGANFKLNSGVYSDVIETVLDKVETSGVVDRNTVYKMWNISAFGGNKLDILSCGEDVLAKYFGLAARFNYLMKANKILLDKENELEEIESEYALNIFISLNRYPKFKQAIVESIKKIAVDKPDFLKPNKPNFAKTFNELMENAIENSISLLDEKQKSEFLLDRQNALRDKNIKIADLLNVETVMTEKADNAGLDGEQKQKSGIIYTLSELAQGLIAGDYFSEQIVDREQINKSVEDFTFASQQFNKGEGKNAKKLHSELVNIGFVKQTEQKVETKKEDKKTGLVQQALNASRGATVNAGGAGGQAGGGGDRKKSPNKNTGKTGGGANRPQKREEKKKADRREREERRRPYPMFAGTQFGGGGDNHEETEFERELNDSAEKANGKMIETASATKDIIKHVKGEVLGSDLTE